MKVGGGIGHGLEKKPLSQSGDPLRRNSARLDAPTFPLIMENLFNLFLRTFVEG